MDEHIEAEPRYPSGATEEEGRAEIESGSGTKSLHLPAWHPIFHPHPRLPSFSCCWRSQGPDGGRGQRFGGGGSAPGTELSNSVKESGSAVLINFIIVTTTLSCSHHIAQKTEPWGACYSLLRVQSWAVELGLNSEARSHLALLPSLDAEQVSSHRENPGVRPA